MGGFRLGAVLTVMLGVSLLFCQHASGCPVADYVPYNGVCYKYFAALKTYDQAKQTCAADGAVLAMPKDAETNAVIYGLGAGPRWLGLNDIRTEGQWVFEDGTTLESTGYQNWHGSEGRGSPGEACAALFASGGSKWFDTGCNNAYQFTCQLDQECPVADYVRFNGACYKAFAEEKTYSGAKDRCAEDGGKLAMPKNDETNTFISRLGAGQRWIGLTDAESEGQWVFEDGTSSGYENWAPGEHNGGNGENCVVISQPEPKWFDVSCSTTRDGFICQTPQACSAPLGMESGAIPDASITASSFWGSNDNVAPRRARLNGKAGYGGWKPANNAVGEWLQVDLGDMKHVTGTVIQGLHSTSNIRWVTSYKLQFSSDQTSWATYKASNGSEKVFTGNTDKNTPVTNLLDRPVKARYVRFYPHTWNIWIGMRAEILGCNITELTTTLMTPKATTARATTEATTIPDATTARATTEATTTPKATTARATTEATTTPKATTARATTETTTTPKTTTARATTEATTTPDATTASATTEATTTPMATTGRATTEATTTPKTTTAGATKMSTTTPKATTARATTVAPITTSTTAEPTTTVQPTTSTTTRPTTTATATTEPKATLPAEVEVERKEVVKKVFEDVTAFKSALAQEDNATQEEWHSWRSGERMPEGYDKNASPQSGETMEVTSSVAILHVGPLSEENANLSVTVEYTMAWLDARLRGLTAHWTPVPAFFMWAPPLAFGTNVRRAADVRRRGKGRAKTSKEEISMWLHSSGVVVHRLTRTLYLTCVPDMGKYPLDQQECGFRLHGYSGLYFPLHPPEDAGSPGPVRTDMTAVVSQFKMTGLAVQSYIQRAQASEPDCTLLRAECEYTGDYCTALRGCIMGRECAVCKSYSGSCQYIRGVCKNSTSPGLSAVSTLEIRLQFSRRLQSHVIQTFLPTSSAVMTSWLAFWFHPGEVVGRVTLGVNTLLSLVVKSSSDRNPVTNLVRAYDVWILACVTMVMMTLLETVVANYVCLGGKLTLFKTRAEVGPAPRRATAWAEEDGDGKNTAEQTATYTAEGTAAETAEGTAADTAEGTADNTTEETASETAEQTAIAIAGETAADTAEGTVANIRDGTAAETAIAIAGETATDTLEETAAETAEGTAANTAEETARAEVGPAPRLSTAWVEEEEDELNTAEPAAIRMDVFARVIFPALFVAFLISYFTYYA